MMKLRADGNSTHRFWVSSEEEPDVEYIVDLCEYEVWLPGRPDPVYNGCCGQPNAGLNGHGCKDFIYRCEPALKKDNTALRRCKHIRFVREQCLDFVLPALLRSDPNIKEEFQC